MNIKSGVCLLVMLVATFLSCSDHDTDEKTDGEVKYKITGAVQKGPFIKNSQITIFALNDDLSATGESYPEQIADDSGNFSINSLIKTNYVELRVNGYYYNENSSSVSEAPLSLQAVASVDKKKVNVNLLTTLSFLRIKRLVANGMDFDASVRKAETEVLKALGMPVGDISGIEFSEMDISGERKADAILLAMSCLLQQSRTTGELSVLISDIASALEADGTLSSSLKEKIHLNEKYINLPFIVKGLFDFYEEKRIDDYKIPPFYHFLDLDGDGQIGEDIAFRILEDGIIPSQDGPVEGFSGEYKVISSTGFTAVSDCSWMKVDKKKLFSDIYEVNYQVEANNGKMREGNILFKDLSGNILETKKIKQTSISQRLYLKIPGTRGVDDVLESSNELKVDEEVLVNGVKYKVEYDEISKNLYVDLPKADSYSVCYPIGLVSPCDDIYSCTVEFFSELSGKQQTPYYGALATPYMVSEIPNPAEVQLNICSASVNLNFLNESMDNLGYVVVEGGNNSILSGKATYLIYNNAPYWDPTYEPVEAVFVDKQNNVKVNIPDGAHSCTFLIYPQTTTLKMALYDKKGKLIEKKEGIEISLKKGNLYRLQW